MSFIKRLHVATNQIGVVPVAHLFEQIVDAALLDLSLNFPRCGLFPYQPDCLVAPSLSPETFERFNMTSLDRGHDVGAPVKNVGILMVFESLSLVGVLVDDEFEKPGTKDALTEKSISVFVGKLRRVSTEPSLDETHPDRCLVADKVNVMTSISHPRHESACCSGNANCIENLQRSSKLRFAAPDHFMIVGSALSVADSRWEVVLPSDVTLPGIQCIKPLRYPLHDRVSEPPGQIHLTLQHGKPR